jgi:hypothetical protein
MRFQLTYLCILSRLLYSHAWVTLDSTRVVVSLGRSLLAPAPASLCIVPNFGMSIGARSCGTSSWQMPVSLKIGFRPTFYFSLDPP